MVGSAIRCSAAQIGISKDCSVRFCVDQLQTVEAAQRCAAGGLCLLWKFIGFIGKCTGNCRNPILFPSNKRGCPANFSSSNSVKKQWKSQLFTGMFELPLLTLLRSHPLTIPGVNHQVPLKAQPHCLVVKSLTQNNDRG